MGDSLNVVVTGGNRGVGRAVAAEAVRRGHHVTITSRQPDAGAAVAREIGADLVVGDLSNLRTARAAAGEIAATVPEIDVLVHNAAVWPRQLVRNEDGFEESFFTNHLAPFLLNHLLERRLRRVVQVSAAIYVIGRPDPERTPAGDDFTSARTYANTKLANLMMVPLFAERWKEAGITIDAVHPGVLRTGLGEGRGWQRSVVRAAKRTLKSADAAAGPVADLLTAEGSGRYFNVRKQQPLKPVARDPELARRVWDDAAKAVDVA